MPKFYELRGICIGLAGDLKAMHRRLLIEAFWTVNISYI